MAASINSKTNFQKKYRENKFIAQYGIYDEVKIRKGKWRLHVIFFNYRGDVDVLLLDLGNLSVTSEKNSLCDENKVIFFM